MAVVEYTETSGALSALNAALNTIGSEFLPTMDIDELGTRCVTLQTARQRLDGIIAAGIAEAERAGVAANAGTRTMAQYLAARTHASPEALRADHRVGTWASQFSKLEGAMFDGRLSRQHIDLLRRTENIRVYMAMQRDQAMFIQFVADLEWKSFQNVLKYWLMVNDQDGDNPDDHEAKNTCTVTTSSANGRVRFTADLDPRTGAILKQGLAEETNRLFDEDQEAGRIRTPTQRRAAALGNLAERGAGRTEATAKPLIHVVMSLKVLLHTIAQMAKETHEQDFTSVLDPNDIDGRCELLNGTPIHPKYALVLLMQARIRRQVLGARSQTLDASVEARLFPAWMKYIKLVETRGQCETAGCDALTHWLQGDHDQPRSKQGETTLTNLKNLCRADNQWKSDGPSLPAR